MMHAHVRVSRLCFAWPNGTPVFEGLSFTLGAQRTGLVAPNGAGKSTLLRLLAGQLAAASGQIDIAGTLAHLPQQFALPGKLRVADALGVAATFDALHAIAAGRMDQVFFDAVGDDWALQERTHASLARLGLEHIALDRRLESLSGGEVMAVRLAAQWLHRPDVLLLDEPSNHLDRDARRRLYQLVEDWDSCLLVASHDRALLERMDQTAELGGGALRTHGGGFGFYQQAVRLESEAAEQEVRNLRQEVKREQRERQQARERTERRAGNAAQNLSSAGLARIVAGNRKRSAQVSAGKSADLHASRLAGAQQRLTDSRSALREVPDLALELPATQVPSARLVFCGKGLQVMRAGRPLFAPEGVDLQIRGPERIAIRGANGAGKTTLAQLISGELAPHSGRIERGTGRTAALSQRLDILDPDATVAGNFAAFAPERGDAERSNLLARWLFRGGAVHVPVSALSGGERLRASLLCVLHALPAPQLLVLDEPTNNLDLPAVRELETALRAYRGAMVVVSHDDAFLDELALTRWLKLEGGRIAELT